MGKYARYKKLYKKEWESLPQFKGWLCMSQADHNDAYCKVCNTVLRAHKTDLIRHSDRNVHKTNMKKVDGSLKKLTDVGVNIIDRRSKYVELKIALFIGLHTSISTVDHLSDLLVELGQGSNLQNIKLHRTKCSMLIKNVISPSLQEELVNDINLNGSQYSLIIDESTDVSVYKYMAVCVRYFSMTKHKILTHYLGIFEVVQATAEILANSLIEFLQNIKLDVTKIIGIGTDGASNLCGVNNSVYTRLREYAKHLQLVKCVAHSISLCSNKASECLPSSLDFLIRETYNWFSCSSVRRSLYKDTFDTVNVQTNVKQHQFVQVAETRWLSRANAVRVILEQWIELQTYFSLVVAKEKSYMGRQLHQMFQDPDLLLYLCAISPILNNLNRVNLLFQSENVDIFKIYLDLYTLLLDIVGIFVRPIFLEGLKELTESNINKIKNILNNQLSFMPIDIIDFGFKFREALRKLQMQCSFAVRERLQSYLLCLAQQLVSRIPNNIGVINALQYLSPKCVLQIQNRPKFNDLPLVFIQNENLLEQHELEWKQLVNVNFNLSDQVDSEEFWIHIYNFKDAGGNYIFKNISKLALTALSLPISNATVERTFSFMNIIKTKIRNKINMDLLDSLIRLKMFTIVTKKCCKNFEITDTMFSKFNSTMYTYTTNNTVDTANNKDNYEAAEETITLFADAVAESNNC